MSVCVSAFCVVLCFCVSAFCVCVCVCVLVLGRFKKENKFFFFFVLGRDHHLSYGSFPSFWHTWKKKVKRLKKKGKKKRKEQKENAPGGQMKRKNALGFLKEANDRRLRFFLFIWP